MLAAGGSIQAQQWPDAPAEARPGTRWWWLGSAVDEKNLTYNLEEYARAGMGAVEITPIYGVQAVSYTHLGTQNIPVGNLCTLGSVDMKLSGITKPQKLNMDCLLYTSDYTLIHFPFLSPHCEILKTEIRQLILIRLLNIKEYITINVYITHRNVIRIRKGSIFTIFQIVKLRPRSYIQTILYIPCYILYQNILIFLRCIRAHL